MSFTFLVYMLDLCVRLYSERFFFLMLFRAPALRVTVWGVKLLSPALAAGLYMLSFTACTYLTSRPLSFFLLYPVYFLRVSSLCAGMIPPHEFFSLLPVTSPQQLLFTCQF